MAEVVYLIGSPHSPRAKIGWSGNVTQRLSAIQRMSPVNLSILWSTEGGRRLEADLHALFRPRRTHGEWFDFSDCDPVEAVDTAMATIKGRELQPAYEVDDTHLRAAELFWISQMPRWRSGKLVNEVRSYDLRWYRMCRNRGLVRTPMDVSGYIIVQNIAGGLWTPGDLDLHDQVRTQLAEESELMR